MIPKDATLKKIEKNETTTIIISTITGILAILTLAYLAFIIYYGITRYPKIK